MEYRTGDALKPILEISERCRDRFLCPSCGAVLAVPDRHKNLRITVDACPECGQAIKK